MNILVYVSELLKKAECYKDNLGCTIRFSKGTDADGMVFIADSAGETILELFRNPVVDPLAKVQNNPVQVRIAFKSTDIEADSEVLLKAGAALVLREEMPEIDQILILHKDPWGNIVQLVQRRADNFVK